MARHRDIRNMDYRDDYDGYDDIYGHSVDDDYCISPSNRQYLYNRESTARNSEGDIKEEDELEAQLSDLERAKLESCIEQIKSTIGALSFNRNHLVNIIVSHNYNIEKSINAILEESTALKTEIKEKDLTKKQFLIPKLNGLKNASSPKTNFVIPNLFNKNSQDNHTIKKPNFLIPNLGKPMTSLPKLGTSHSNKEFKSLSEVVSQHLDSQINVINEELKKITLENEIKNVQIDNDIVERIEQVKIVDDEPLPCTFDSKDLLTIRSKLLKCRSKFAKVLCTNYKRSPIKLSKGKQILPKRIKLFDFKTPSPDDGIKQYLKR